MNTPHLFRYVRPVLALLIVVGSFGFLYILAYRSVPETNKDTINLAAGFVLGVLSTVAAYYFGNSKDKSDQEQAARSNTAPPPPTTP